MHRRASFQRNLQTEQTFLFFDRQQLSKKIIYLGLYVTSIVGLAAPVAAAAAKEPTTLMCLPGERIFSETFDPDTVSHRWAFKGDFSLRDGSLRRTNSIQLKIVACGYRTPLFTTRLFSLISSFQIEQRTSAWLLGVGVIQQHYPNPPKLFSSQYTKRS